MPKVVPGYKEEAKEKILDATLRTMKRKGYRDTKMKDIAQEVGVSKAALYQYFESKDDLFKKASWHMIQEIESNIWEQVFSDGITEMASPDFYGKINDVSSEYRDLTLEVFIEARRDPGLLDTLKEFIEEGLTYFVESVEEQKRRGVIKGDVDAKSLTLGIIALHEGFNIVELFGIDREEHGKSWQYIIGLIFESIINDEEHG
jgi:AcrR family transcriptional regulator